MRRAFLLIQLIIGVFAACPPDTIAITDAELCIAAATTQYLNYSAAASRCFNSKGRLSHIENAFDNHVALKAAQNKTPFQWFYIGIRRIDGAWRYQDDELEEMPISYANWAQNEPSQVSGNDCAVMSTTDGKWYAKQCQMSFYYFCDLLALPTSPYCTDTAKADILFMVDASGNDADIYLVHEVLRGFNSALQTNWYSPSACDDSALKKQISRVSGLVYYSDTFVPQPTPIFCVDQFDQIVANTALSLNKTPFVSDISAAIMAAHNYTEGSDCSCRRTAPSYGTKQVMIWMPNSDKYGSSKPVSLDLLPSWNHFMLPIKFTKANATFPLWTDPRMIEITQPDRDNFIPTLIMTTWRLLCNLTGQSGEVPPPPFI